MASLPWKAFTYKAFNTFIDDVFAFIITMPTSHRLACFRDDVVAWLQPIGRVDVTGKAELTREHAFDLEYWLSEACTSWPMPVDMLRLIC